jgi:DNA-binding response OmpR family regulator
LAANPEEEENPDAENRQASTHTFIQTRYGVGYRLEPVVKA